MLGVQLHITKVEVLAEQVASVENDPDGCFRKKPKYGLWTSTFREETQYSDWIEWCRGENFGNPDNGYWFLLTPREEARLYNIDTYADLERLMKEYPYLSPLAQRLPSSDSYMLKYLTGIDFERLAQDYDGLHLTELGNRRLHLSYPLDLNSWDSESTLWFRWCFTTVERIEPRVMAQEV